MELVRIPCGLKVYLAKTQCLCQPVGNVQQAQLVLPGYHRFLRVKERGMHTQRKKDIVRVTHMHSQEKKGKAEQQEREKKEV